MKNRDHENSREWEKTGRPWRIETMENSREWEQIERPHRKQILTFVNFLCKEFSVQI